MNQKGEYILTHQNSQRQIQITLRSANVPILQKVIIYLMGLSPDMGSPEEVDSFLGRKQRSIKGKVPMDLIKLVETVQRVQVVTQIEVSQEVSHQTEEKQGDLKASH